MTENDGNTERFGVLLPGLSGKYWNMLELHDLTRGGACLRNWLTTPAKNRLIGADSPNSASAGSLKVWMSAYQDGHMVPAGANTGESMLRVSPKMDEITKLLKTVALQGYVWGPRLFGDIHFYSSSICVSCISVYIRLLLAILCCF